MAHRRDEDTLSRDDTDFNDDEGILEDLESFFDDMEEEGKEGGEATTTDPKDKIEVETEVKSDDEKVWENDDEENLGYDEE